MDEDRLDKIRGELRRGVLVLAVLASLHQEHYGYSLRKQMIAAGIDIDEGTLYPLVRRLEKQGLLSSEWREGEGRKKRYYTISADGKAMYQILKDEWNTTNSALNALMER
ncbi:PadR family transcriptional regulator [Echinimonas agarilytica]|uniref:PadR family transcriptional regulator n=1 Tax=Echinimonas agarilytica TaxID=1215918 RepID=A0AA42B6H1_9GAMM|nr:PadR family transcriptional regulator [Echinimonas agarilytica]MCM2678654.1 PadR family transcriptional regulator [Echinimonas agarilytica]